MKKMTYLISLQKFLEIKVEQIEKKLAIQS